MKLWELHLDNLDCYFGHHEGRDKGIRWASGQAWPRALTCWPGEGERGGEGVAVAGRGTGVNPNARADTGMQSAAGASAVGAEGLR